MRGFKSAQVSLRRQLELEQHAWCNRRSLTGSEARFWEALRGCKLGVPFRRQVPLAGRYIVDFAAPVVRLVVEVDGGCHARRRRANEQRDRELNRLGWRVLRVPAAVVMRDLPAAIQRTIEALMDTK